MNREEANTYKSENEKHKIKVAFLNEQLALSKDNAEKVAEINQALTDEQSRHQQETIKITRDYVTNMAEWSWIHLMLLTTS